MRHLLFLLCFLPLLSLSAQEMVDVPGGTFLMGCNDSTACFDEQPVHEVTLRAFRLARCEVTNAEYERYCPEHRVRRGTMGLSTADDEAVVGVTYADAVGYCRWLSERTGRHFRLPTEAEWEYACRAGGTTRYDRSDSLPNALRRIGQTVRTFSPVSLRVGVTPANAFGICDLHGNVEEWCSDWYAPYVPGHQYDPQGPATGEMRITRGGSHHTPDAYLRSANRSAMLPDDSNVQVGFRIAEDIVATAAADSALFLPPIPFVIAPTDGSPYYVHNHQPALACCPDGSLLVAWYSTPAESSREMCVLSSRLDQPASPTAAWTPATLFFRVPDRGVTGTALLADTLRHRLLHINGVEQSGDWQNLSLVMRESTDGGRHWSPARLIAPQHALRHQAVAGPIVTREGYLVQACDAGPESHDGTALLISRDGGNTWSDPHAESDVAAWRKQWPTIAAQGGGTGDNIAGIHAGLVQLRDGSLFALGRGNAIKGDDGRLYMPASRSTDFGATWQYSASPFPPIDGGQRLVLLRLAEGPLLLVAFTHHPDRTPAAQQGLLMSDGSRGYGLYCALSYDDGATWPIKRLLTDGTARTLDGGGWTGIFHTDATHAEPKGYLAGTQTPDGLIHIVSSRLHYRFNLEWLEAVR